MYATWCVYIVYDMYGEWCLGDCVCKALCGIVCVKYFGDCLYKVLWGIVCVKYFGGLCV